MTLLRDETRNPRSMSDCINTRGKYGKTRFSRSRGFSAALTAGPSYHRLLARLNTHTSPFPQSSNNEDLDDPRSSPPHPHTTPIVGDVTVDAALKALAFEFLHLHNTLQPQRTSSFILIILKDTTKTWQAKGGLTSRLRRASSQTTNTSRGTQRSSFLA